METVIILNFGTSVSIFSNEVLSKRIALFTFSLFLPLDHFFFFCLPPPLLALAALDCAFESFFGSAFLGGILPLRGARQARAGHAARTRVRAAATTGAAAGACRRIRV